MKTLLLWDIDGTLITARGAGKAALSVAVRQAFGIEDDLHNIDLHGRTDQYVFRIVLQQVGVNHNGENVAKLREGYLAALPACLASYQITLLPGIAQLLEQASKRGDVAQGLLTGNLREGAEIKLQSRGVWHYFPFGAFADDEEDRNKLGPHALRRAAAFHGEEFPPERVWIIGDTPLDIACGKAFGAKTLGVATGKHAVDHLRSAQPDAVLADCADSELFWRTVLPA